MSTRSFIGIKNEDDSINAIYCHQDGYPEWNGRILSNYYKTTESVKELLALGGLSSLNERVAPNEGEEHSFDSPAKGVTVAYHRDRGEEYCPSAHFKDMDRTIERANDCWVEYIYLWDKDHWICYNVLKETYRNLYI